MKHVNSNTNETTVLTLYPRPHSWRTSASFGFTDNEDELSALVETEADASDIKVLLVSSKIATRSSSLSSRSSADPICNILATWLDVDALTSPFGLAFPASIAHQDNMLPAKSLRIALSLVESRFSVPFVRCKLKLGKMK